MDNELVSVIMSVYNETFDELYNSISSILEQTYRNIELIIINDNPENENLNNDLKNICGHDPRIKVFDNDKNRGLVYSLNRALKIANGKFIARMDPDDISDITRIEDQFEFLIVNDFDLIGSNIELIDEDGNVIGKMQFPISTSRIKFYIKWGSCLPHPSWFGRREVFEKLNGYRYMPHCEDYDFILRALKVGFCLGNIQKFDLMYRIRRNGISVSNYTQQTLVRMYLSRKRNRILTVSEKDIHDYLESRSFVKDYKTYSRYQSLKYSIKSKKKFRLLCCFELLFIKYFYFNLIERVMIKERGKKI